MQTPPHSELLVPEQNRQRPGISGKKLTLVVAICLCVATAGLVYALWTYSRLDQARDSTAAAWRGVTEELEHRYSTIEAQLAATGEPGVAPSGFAERYSQAVDSFRTTSFIGDQQAAAQAIETMLADASFRASIDRTVDPALRSAVEDYNECRVKERKILSTPGGELLDLFLEFQQVEPFELAL